MSSPHIEQIREIAGRIIESESLDLVDIEFKTGGNRDLVRIFIDKEGGVSLSDCENVSRQISAQLDVKDFMKNAYVLEVSSRGLDRPLKTDRDYRRTIGWPVRIHFSQEDGKIIHVTGKLVEANDSELVLEDAGKLRAIPRDSVKKVVQEIIPGQSGKKKWK